MSKICLIFLGFISLSLAFRLDISVNRTEVQKVVSEWMNYENTQGAVLCDSKK